MKINKVPNYTVLRQGKAGYDTRYEIDTGHPLYNDPLVDPREFGFDDASSYYSKPNGMTGDVLPGIPDAPLVRLDIMNRLVHAEQLLRSDGDIRELLGAPARIKIDDALRPYEVQKFAYEIAWPQVIRKMNPDITDVELVAELPKYVAKPSDRMTPTPHLTGGAVDVGLINLETGEVFDRGHKGGAIKGTAFPDFHEGYHLLEGESDNMNDHGNSVVAKEGSPVRNYRRVLHSVMAEAGLYVNPTEIWHYGKGDPLSEYVSGSGHPYYGIAKLPDWYVEEMNSLRQ